MTRGNDNAAPGEQPGHGAKQARSDRDFPALLASAQREKLLAYLKRHGDITTIEARSILAIMAPASRVWELKNWAGHRIITVRDNRRVARYILLPGQESGGTHG